MSILVIVLTWFVHMYICISVSSELFLVLCHILMINRILVVL